MADGAEPAPDGSAGGVAAAAMADKEALPYLGVCDSVRGVWWGEPSG
jgi:hypothetical protein